MNKNKQETMLFYSLWAAQNAAMRCAASAILALGAHSTTRKNDGMVKHDPGNTNTSSSCNSPCANSTCKMKV